MKTSSADASRRRPVALRSNTWVPPTGGGSAAMSFPLSGHELAGLELAVAAVGDGPIDDSLRVGAAGVHDRRPADLGNAFGFMDVPVQREHGLVSLDQLAHAS